MPWTAIEEIQTAGVRQSPEYEQPEGGDPSLEHCIDPQRMRAGDGRCTWKEKGCRYTCRP